MTFNHFSIDDQKLIQQCLKKIDNVNVNDKLALLSGQSKEPEWKPASETARKIHIISSEFSSRPDLKEVLLHKQFESLVKNIDMYNNKPFKQTPLLIFQQKRRDEILYEAQKDLNTWYKEVGAEWVNSKIPTSKLNEWNNQSFLNQIVKSVLRNGYDLSENSEILNSSIGKGDRELFDLALSNNASVNGPENASKAFLTPLAHYPRPSSHRSPEATQELYDYMLKELLRRGADVNRFHNTSSSYVNLSITMGNAYQLTKLLENGAKADNRWTDEKGVEHSTLEKAKIEKKGLTPLIEEFIEKQTVKQYSFKL